MSTSTKYITCPVVWECVGSIVASLFLAGLFFACADVAPPPGDGADGSELYGDHGRRGSSEQDADPSRDGGSDAPDDAVLPTTGDAVDDIDDLGPTIADQAPRGDSTDEACALTTAAAENITLPVDIIIFIDTSTSMDQETDRVEENTDDLANFISRSGIDYRVILIGEDSEVCMPSPPSGGGCPDIDSTTYLHVRDKVDSREGFTKVVEHYPDYQDFLRAGAKVHIIGVTDDTDDESWSWFRGRMESLTDPGFPDGFVFHSIVAQGSIPIIGCCGLTGCGAMVGYPYLQATAATGGVSASM